MKPIERLITFSIFYIAGYISGIHGTTKEHIIITIAIGGALYWFLYTIGYAGKAWKIPDIAKQ